MLDVSNKKHISEMPFDAFIGFLVRQTNNTKSESDNYSIVEKIKDYQSNLSQAFKQLSQLSEKKKLSTGGVQWFLDNYFVIQEAIEIIKDDLPEDYFNKLPSITGRKGTPRIYWIARAMILFYRVEIVISNINQFLNAYQQEINLQMSELWALPLMLRLVLIEILSGTINDLMEDETTPQHSSDFDLKILEPDEIIARALQTLLLFDRIDWKDLFEQHSKVEEILRKDPAGVYSKMDFETRDQYRKKIEILAEKSTIDELETAQAVVELADQSDNQRQKTNHIGFYLIGEGEEKLRSKINYRSDFNDKLRIFFKPHRVGLYISSILLVTLVVVVGLLVLSRPLLPKTWELVIIGILSFIPASSVAVNLINSILTATLPPRILPKMDYSESVPKISRTVIAIPALLTTQDEIDFLLRQLELHYLANRDRNIGFVLLTDFGDAPKKTMPEDDNLIRLAVDGIHALNKRYRGDEGRRPFYIFHRLRQWNPKEDAWMGWERKRGKLTDFNRFLLDEFDESFDTIVGELDYLRDVKYVITVDADTIIPRDSANSLIATMAHPLNRPEFNKDTSEIVNGYTILQPRTEVKPTSVIKSIFTRVFAGDLGLDLYTRAVSDVYQDLFGEGIYVGKGIYDVEAFERSLQEKVPQNALLSHDLFEGIQGRAGLVSDVVFFEEYPPDYASHIQRLHRWVRGDWQLFPWLFQKVPVRGNKKESNPFSAVDIWKIVDNLRRSLLTPTTFLALVAGWVLFQERVWLWTALILLISAFTLFKNIVTSLSSRFLKGAKANIISNIQTAFIRWIFWLVFLPFETLTMIDAILTTLVRIYISHKRLLQWQTSAHTIRLFGKQRKIRIIWSQMFGAPLMSVSVGLLVYLINPNALLMSLPLFIIWLVSPQIAYWISDVRERDTRAQQLLKKDIQSLRTIARRTWLYFERFIGPEDHWLPPDHFQEDPKGIVAHRTSPTNIGLMLISTASAYDMGYIGVLDFIYRMIYSFETIDNLEKYRGHLLNWYDTQTLKTLSPRYVSSVDSGNFGASLIGLYQTLKDLPNHAVCPTELFQGIVDILEIFCSILDSIENKAFSDMVRPLLIQCHKIEDDIQEKSLTDSRQMDLLQDIEERLTEPMNELIQQILVSDKTVDPDILQDFRYWSNAVYQHLTNIKHQIEHLAPWIATWRNQPAYLDEPNVDKFDQVFGVWRKEQALQTKLADLPELCHLTIEGLKKLKKDEEFQRWCSNNKDKKKEFEKWIDQFIDDLNDTKEHALNLRNQIDFLIEKIDFYVDRMEFDFLFDKKREVFYLGYQVGSGRLDENHYDLLASEARTASLFAIAKNDVPRSHWLHMSRPFTSVHGIPTLLSWNGSMFEYLMPNLFTRTYPETLLHQTCQGVVKAQIEYAKQNNVPWGISESSFYRFDQAQNYQYQGFGVPGLGRKRGLGDDLVIAPYASLMAVDVDPQSVLDNIQALEQEHALGHFGFFESIDYTSTRLPIGQEKAVIKSYMAHHQGMIMVALSNFLNRVSIVDRTHKDPRIQSAELLLQEQIPQAEHIEKTEETEMVSRTKTTQGISVAPWRVDTGTPGLEVHALSNGQLRMIMTDSGSGYLQWKDIALTRWRQDSTMDIWGIWYFIQDLESEKSWSIGKQPLQRTPNEYQVLFAPHMTEIRRVEKGIRLNLQTTITPEDDVCLQKMTLTNQTNERRSVRILSYGEVILAPQKTDQRHPAFNKMFIESSFDKDLCMLHYQRRKRSSDEEPQGMAHMVFDDIPGKVEYESDRAKFIGRNHDISNPIALSGNAPLGKTVGVTLDPIFSLGRRITLDPHQPVTLTFMTLASPEKEQAKAIARKYRDATKVDNAFATAESNSEKMMRSLNLDTDSLAKYQQFLSRIIYPIPELRTESDVINNNELGQSGLWSFGISGDYPIILVMIDRQDELETLQETLMAHAYWRKMGLLIDLVILNTKDAGYTHELNERIHHLINVMDSINWINQRGGLFVLTASQMQEAQLRLLKTAANVALDFKTRNLKDHLRHAKAIAPHLPPFVPTGEPKKFEVEDQIKRPSDLVLDNGIGGFTADGKEYQIFLEDYPKLAHKIGQVTPAPWINVVSNENFGFLISESGGGYTWSQNSGENRLTPWTNDPVSDPSGESLYLRDEITGKVWSPMPFPSGNDVNYLVRHGQGYTIFESINSGFKQHLRIFIDSEKPVKIIELSLVNLTEEHRRLTATYFAEWVLGTDRETTRNFIVPVFDNKTSSLFASNTYSEEFSQNIAFLSSDRAIHGLTTDRREFLGEPGNRQIPAGLRRLGLSGQVESGLDPCAALQTHLNLKPGETQKVIFVLGQGEDTKQAQKLAEEFTVPDRVNEAWEEVINTWDEIINTLQVETPDKSMNILLNRWLPYQALSCRIWGRSALYQSSGAYGFRDQLQDVTSILASKPEIAREHILHAAEHQFEAGDVLHWWQPPSGRGVRTRISDDLLWLVYVTAEYVKKTGDVDILREKTPFRIGNPLEEDEKERYSHYPFSDEEATLFEHCRRALERGDTQGPHGLPLIGTGDWNDGFNRVGIEGKGESVWLAWFLYENHKRFSNLCEIMGKHDMKQDHEKRAMEILGVIHQVAWDDDWYLRAYYDDGTPLGSHKNKECQIDSLPQSWSILTQEGQDERQIKAIESVEKHLVREEDQLIRLFTPPFDKTNKDPGYIKGYPPGIRENGGQYTHAAIWAVWALTKLRKGNQAFKQFKLLNPILHSLNIDDANRYVVEPYVVAADIYSTSPFTGQGGWTWYTGSSGWLFRLGTEAILGFQLQGDHFTINPCIPDSWEEYKLLFQKNGSHYDIRVENPNHVESGVKIVLLDGEELDGKDIPIHGENSKHTVRIIMG
jgi:cyclic beta-1,2-glucan synthetase